MMEFVIFFLSYTGVICAIIQYEARHSFEKSGGVSDNANRKLNFLLIICWVCSILASKRRSLNSATVITVVARQKLFLKWRKAKRMFHSVDTLITTGLHHPIILDIIILLIQPLPYFDNVTYLERYPDLSEKPVEQRYNNVLLCLATLLRLRYFVRCVLSYSPYMQVRTQSLCFMAGTEANFLYSLKAVMKDKPMTFMLISLTLPMAIGGFNLRMFERPVMEMSG